MIYKNDDNHETRRWLATLRMPSDKDDDNTTTATTFLDTHPTAVVNAMHATPRFGYSHHIGLLTSPDPMEYAGGVKQFTLFYLIVPFILWMCLLSSFKHCYGLQKVGCAAGGEVLDMYYLSKELGLSRKQRKRRILRSWKLQSVFLIAAICIPIASIVMTTVGLTTLTTSIVELQEWVGDVETLAFKGWSSLQGLQQTQQGLIVVDSNNNITVSSNNLLVQGMLDYHDNYNDAATQQEELNKFIQHHPDQVIIDGHVIYEPPPSTTTTTSNAFVETWCPGAANTSSNELDVFFNAMDTIQENTQEMVYLLQHFGESSATQQAIASAFRTVTDTTQNIESIFEWVLQHDWMLKMLIMALNVVSFGLFLNVFLLSKNNVIHPPTRFYVAWVLMPLFVALLMAVFIITLLLGILILANADFCSGGGMEKSVQGTLEDALLGYFQGGNLDNRINTTSISIASLDQALTTPPLILATATLEYYASGCFSDNPLEFLDVVTSQLDVAAAQVNQLASILLPLDNGDVSNSNNNHTALLNDACYKDMSFLFPSLQDLNDKMGLLSTNLHKLTDNVIGCHQISPLYKRLTHGALCHESPHGLTVLWVCALILCILGFIMLTTRAALYNSVKPKKPRERKPRRVVEKEFDSYKEFMKEYYDNTDGWMLDEPLPSEYGDAVAAIKATQIAVEFHNAGLESKSTFETTPSSGASSSPGSDGNLLRRRSPRQRNRGAASAIGGIHNRHNTSVEVSHLCDHGDDMSCGSSYDSECSDDSLEDKDDGRSLDDDDDDESAILSFFSETRSMAMQTIHSLQRLKPLLASVIPSGLLPSPKEEESDEYDDDAFLFQDKHIGMEGKDGAGIPEPSVCNVSLYLGDSIAEPPLTPGLKPASVLVFGDKSTDEEEGDNNDGLEYPNPYTNTTSKDDGMLKERSKMSSLFGRSVRHHSHRPKNAKKPKVTKTNTPPRVLEVLTPSSIMSALTPLAPYKPFSFLTRAKKEETDGLLNNDNTVNDVVFEDWRGDENNVLGTPSVRHRSKSRSAYSPSVFSLSPGVESPMLPTKLEMSPLLVPRHHEERHKKPHEYRRTVMSGPWMMRRIDFQQEFTTVDRHTTNAAVTLSGKAQYKGRGSRPSQFPMATPSKTTLFHPGSVQELVNRFNNCKNKSSSSGTIDEDKAASSIAFVTTSTTQSARHVGSSARRQTKSSSSSSWKNYNTAK